MTESWWRGVFARKGITILYCPTHIVLPTAFYNSFRLSCNKIEKLLHFVIPRWPTLYFVIPRWPVLFLIKFRISRDLKVDGCQSNLYVMLKQSFFINFTTSFVGGILWWTDCVIIIFSNLCDLFRWGDFYSLKTSTFSS